MRVARQRLAELAVAGGRGEVLDQRRRRGEERVEAVLDGAVGERDRQVRLARTARPAEDERVALRDELRTEGTAEQREADGGLEGEVVLVDRLEKREVRPVHASLDTRLRPVRDLFGHQQGEEVAIRQALGFRALGELGIEPAHRRQMQPAQEPVEVDRRRGDGGHAPVAMVRASCVRTYSAPTAPWSTPQASA